MKLLEHEFLCELTWRHKTILGDILTPPFVRYSLYFGVFSLLAGLGANILLNKEFFIWLGISASVISGCVFAGWAKYSQVLFIPTENALAFTRVIKQFTPQGLRNAPPDLVIKKSEIAELILVHRRRRFITNLIPRNEEGKGILRAFGNKSIAIHTTHGRKYMITVFNSYKPLMHVFLEPMCAEYLQKLGYSVSEHFLFTRADYKKFYNRSPFALY